MAYSFFINKGSTLPSLRMEINNDGRNDFRNVWYMLQSANVTFTMTNKDTGVKKIANAPAYIVEKEKDGCNEEYIIEYRWKERDTKESGVFIGKFTIDFNTPIKIEGKLTPTGKLIVPISEELEIYVNEGSIKK